MVALFSTCTGRIAQGKVRRHNERFERPGEARGTPNNRGRRRGGGLLTVEVTITVGCSNKVAPLPKALRTAPQAHVSTKICPPCYCSKIPCKTAPLLLLSPTKASPKKKTMKKKVSQVLERMVNEWLLPPLLRILLQAPPTSPQKCCPFKVMGCRWRPREEHARVTMPPH
eukprot:Gb_06592 [translate_table: standard]